MRARGVLAAGSAQRSTGHLLLLGLVVVLLAVLLAAALRQRQRRQERTYRVRLPETDLRLPPSALHPAAIRADAAEPPPPAEPQDPERLPGGQH